MGETSMGVEEKMKHKMEIQFEDNANDLGEGQLGCKVPNNGLSLLQVFLKY